MTLRQMVNIFGGREVNSCLILCTKINFRQMKEFDGKVKMHNDVQKVLVKLVTACFLTYSTPAPAL